MEMSLKETIEIEYKNAIEYLYFYPEERLRLSRNAREYARQNFHPEQGTKKINKIYTQLLKKPKRKQTYYSISPSRCIIFEINVLLQ